ncbi:hypothetical protein [Acidisoma sp.]|uniref:hypothetical protein n=1 Tax=Acidisoma sp. TaxID=1872115 RepID=UPI003B00397A
MAEKIEKKTGNGLRRFAAVEGDMIVNRPPRRSITGIEFANQISRMLLDQPDATGNHIYPCKIANVSDEGFGVVCGAARTIPHPFHTGGQLTLQESDGERVRVEIRWIKSDRLGLRRLSARPTRMA